MYSCASTSMRPSNSHAFLWLLSSNSSKPPRSRLSNRLLFLSFSIHPSRLTRLRLLEEDVVQRRNNSQTNSSPPSANDLLVGEPNTHIPQQMPDTVEAVEEHGESKEALQRDLRRRGPRSNRRNHAGSLKVPSRVRRSEVGETEQVQRAGQSDACDAVQGRGVPGDLRAVDGEMGRDGALEALLCEDLGGGFLRGGLGCCEPAIAVSIGLDEVDMLSAGTCCRIDGAVEAAKCRCIAEHSRGNH
jgi:hypothetical protein